MKPVWVLPDLQISSKKGLAMRDNMVASELGLSEECIYLYLLLSPTESLSVYQGFHGSSTSSLMVIEKSFPGSILS
ncbi:MAG: hypothetical protein ACM37W_08405 [Actinomycetota bacterium]